MSTFIMMIGIPGAGKSMYAEKFANEYDAQIFSYDDYKSRLAGHESDASYVKSVYNDLYNDMLEVLKSGKNVIFDSTNVQQINRKVILDIINQIDCYKIAVFIKCHVDNAIKHDSLKDKQTPPVLINKLNDLLDIPKKEEGFNEIITIVN